MTKSPLGADLLQAVKDVLGYINFSSGTRDPKVFRALNALYAFVDDPGGTKRKEPVSAVRVLNLLEDELRKLSTEGGPFRADDQAGQILELVRDSLLPGFRKFHENLLFHQTDEHLFNPFFLAKVFECVLRQGGPWNETDRIVEGTIESLNEYIGYRPVPTLEGEEKHQPNDHEWVAPIPLYIAGIGTAYGPYQQVVEQTLRIFQETDPGILYDACFNFTKLHELVLDPRAYDFDHPVNRKPNYHFGIWDPHFIGNDGYYRRFVIHQVTLDGIMHRMQSAYMGESEAAPIPQDELLYEAGAVLVGTMLMGSGVCGDTPSTHDSETALTDLMPIIAAYRDRFYDQIVEKIPKKMKPRIDKERERLHQPFGGCRQALNKQLAKRRADQLQRMHLSRIFARMGYFEAATHQTDIIAVASARILTKVDCLITQSHFLIDRGKLDEAADLFPPMEQLIRDGIRCGAIVDPWTIIGFGAQFSLFHAVENTIHDHRVDELINLVEDIFDLYSRVQKEAAAAGKGDLQADVSDKMSDLAGWWDQFGSTDVSGLESFSGYDAWDSAAKVSTALAAWHQAGSAAGDIAFWNRHVERFKSTKAFVLLAEALLDQRDQVASMALMMYWLSHSETIPLTEGDYSFHSIALRWMEQLWKDPNPDDESTGTTKKFPPLSPPERWKLARKFFDFIEANADRYWSVPDVELDDDLFDENAKGKNKSRKGKKKGKGRKKGPLPKDEIIGEFEPHQPDDDDEGSIYSAAYENVTYHDTTDDGIDDSMMDAPNPHFRDEDDFELAEETERISDRLAFVVTMAKLWKFVTERVASLSTQTTTRPEIRAAVAEAPASLEVWLQQIGIFASGLETLLKKVETYQVPEPKGTTDSLLQYDRHRGTKEILIDRIVWTSVEVADAQMILESLLGEQFWKGIIPPWKNAVLFVNNAIFRGDIKSVKRDWSAMLRTLAKETILYVPTSRGGAAAAIVRCRCVQQAILRLLEYAPRLGLLTEGFQLLNTIQVMEENNPISPGAITEFDRLFETGTRAITQCVAISSKSWKFKKNAGDDNVDVALVDYMERILQPLLENNWLAHSKQIRISPVESISDKVYWSEIKGFIQRYGKDIFTQQNMGFGNLRAVLHQGVDNYLRSLVRVKQEEGEVEMAGSLLDDIQTNRIAWDEAVSRLEIIFECIAENYSEYVDYNSTSTHSDNGEKMYMLLDMLRVQTGYERISWNLKPVYWVHDAMIRAKCDNAALLWERAIAKKSVETAENYLRDYTRLSEKYGMWLPSVHERLQERFVRPLQIDRMCGLVSMAVRQAKEDGPKPVFQELHAQIEGFAKEPMGVGFEMPEWLTALQEEVMSTRTDVAENEKDKDVFSITPHFDQVNVTRAQLDKVLESWNRRYF